MKGLSEHQKETKELGIKHIQRTGRCRILYGLPEDNGLLAAKIDISDISLARPTPTQLTGMRSLIITLKMKIEIRDYIR